MHEYLILMSFLLKIVPYKSILGLNLYEKIYIHI